MTEQHTEKDKASPSLSEKVRRVLSSRAAEEFFPDAAVFLLGLLFARSPLFYGAYPFALSLFCAQRRRWLPCLIGAVIGALTLPFDGWVYGVGLLLAVGLRALVSSPRIHVAFLPPSEGYFSELPQMSLAVSAFCAVFFFVLRAVLYGLTTDTLLYGVCMCAGAVLCTFLFAGFFVYPPTKAEYVGGQSDRVLLPRRVRILREVGTLALLFCFLRSLDTLSLFGLRLAYLFATALTLYLGRRFGALRGCVSAFLITLGVEAVYAPAFALLGLISGALHVMGTMYAVVGGVVGGVVWCAYIGGLSGFLSVAPEMMIAGLLTGPFLSKFPSHVVSDALDEKRKLSEQVLRERESHGEGDSRLARLSDAFDGLSRVWAAMPDDPDEDDCFSACDKVFTRYCAECEERGACWDSESRPAVITLSRVAKTIAHHETVDAESLRDEIGISCPHLTPLSEDLCTLASDIARTHGQGYPYEEYALTARLLEDASREERTSQMEDTVMEHAIVRALEGLGVRPAVASVKGGREREIHVASPAFPSAHAEIQKIHRTLEELCGTRLTPPVFTPYAQSTLLECRTQRRYALSVAHDGRAAKSGELSGDTVGIFPTPDGYTYLLLSDGMGTGKTASQAANTCALFLEKMLTAGNGKNISLSMLNHLLRSQRSECAVTVDLFAFDAYDGSASFYKSGAAASYVKRDGKLFRMHARTIPLGIMEDLDTERISFETRAGDTLILLSDGVSAVSEDAPWLMELLSKPLDPDPAAVARQILDGAARQALRVDDMTVIVAQVQEIPRDEGK